MCSIKLPTSVYAHWSLLLCKLLRTKTPIKFFVLHSCRFVRNKDHSEMMICTNKNARFYIVSSILLNSRNKFTHPYDGERDVDRIESGKRTPMNNYIVFVAFCSALYISTCHGSGKWCSRKLLRFLNGHNDGSLKESAI